MIRYKNEKGRPLDDVGEALKLLYTGRYRCQATLHVERRGEVSFIQRDHFGGHYDEWFAGDVFYVTDRVVTELKNQRFVSGAPQWGFTDERKCHLNAWGETEHFRLEQARRAEEAEQNRQG